MLLSFIISSSEFARFPQQRTGFRGHVLAEVTVIEKIFCRVSKAVTAVSHLSFF